MNDTRPELVNLRARYVLSGRGDVFPGGVVSIRGQRIASVGDLSPAGRTIDLGNVAILPGLVNAHTHLEFSDLDCPLGEPGMPLPDWIGRVIAFRGQVAEVPRDAVAIGLRESISAGTTSLGEIATPGWSCKPFQKTPLDCTVFSEIIGLAADRIVGGLAAAREFVESSRHDATWRAGISPHAPYSVHQQLVRELAEWAARANVPLAMHLAESREELELLRTGQGPLRRRLDELGVWDDSAVARGSRVLDYLRVLHEAPSVLVIHGNYLNDDEIAFLAEHATTMSVVYCPRTHAYFAHDEHPVERLLAAGARVALGTDSRASSPSLSLLDDMRLVARRHPGLAGEQVLELATLCGARALGIDDETGTLEAGKRADLAVVALGEDDPRDPYARLLDCDMPVVATICRGSVVYRHRDLAGEL